MGLYYRKDFALADQFYCKVKALLSLDGVSMQLILIAVQGSSIRTDRAKQTVQTFRQQFYQDLHCLPFYLHFWTYNCIVNPICSIFSTITVLIFDLRCPKF